MCCFGQNYATIYRLANGYLLFLQGASFSCSQRPSDLFSPSSPPPPCALIAGQWNPPRFLFSYASSTIAKEKAEGLSTGYKLKSLISSEFHLHIMNFLNVFSRRIRRFLVIYDIHVYGPYNLLFLCLIKTSCFERNMQTNTTEPLVSGCPKCEEFIVVAYGRWSLERIGLQDVASKKRSKNVHFSEWIRAISKLRYQCSSMKVLTRD